jgi:2-dehydropantoate 2-reductase
MRIVIVGAGGIGGLLGASLASAGQEVHFVARGAHLAAMRDNGLRITGDRGEGLIRPVQATDDPAEIGPVDLVLFCVKLWDVETAGERLRPLLGAETAVIPLQNGIDASERLVPILGAAHVLGGVAVLTGAIVAPGVVRQSGTHHRVTFGELDGRRTARVERILGICRDAGIDATVSDDINRARWEKFILLVAASSLCTVTRRPIGELRDDPDIAPLFEEMMREVVSVGRARGIRFAADVIDPLLEFLGGVPSNWIPSMTTVCTWATGWNCPGLPAASYGWERNTVFQHRSAGSSTRR